MLDLKHKALLFLVGLGLNFLSTYINLESHLFFVDYLVLFGKVDEKNWQSIKDALDVFCDLSEQKVNYGKFRDYFPPNVSEDRGGVKASGTMANHFEYC